jgi:hypothetical protein
MKKGKKLWILIGVAGMTVNIATLNLHLNVQKIRTNVSLVNIEALSRELTDIEEDILLQGSLYYMTVRSYSSTPFQAIKHSSHITVYCLMDLNNISVKVVNASGQIVYSTNVNPVAGGQLDIGFTSLPSGEYTLVFSNANGNSVYGDFEI